MEVLYDEDLASHIGPESCGSAREDRAVALTGERAGRPLSRDSQYNWVPTWSSLAEGNMEGCATASNRLAPAWSWTPACTEAPCLGTGRISRLTVQSIGRSASGRPAGGL